LLQVLCHGSSIAATDGTSQRHDFSLGFDALEYAFAETDQHGTPLIRCHTTVRQHGETEAHQTRQQVASHCGSGVVEHFVLGLNFANVTAKVTNQSAGDVLCRSVPLNAPVYTTQDLWISNGRTKGI
jgi:hypothetical protein